MGCELLCRWGGEEIGRWRVVDAPLIAAACRHHPAAATLTAHHHRCRRRHRHRRRRAGSCLLLGVLVEPGYAMIGYVMIGYAMITRVMIGRVSGACEVVVRIIDESDGGAVCSVVTCVDRHGRFNPRSTPAAPPFGIKQEGHALQPTERRARGGGRGARGGEEQQKIISSL